MRDFPKFSSKDGQDVRVHMPRQFWGCSQDELEVAVGQVDLKERTDCYFWISIVVPCKYWQGVGYDAVVEAVRIGDSDVALFAYMDNVPGPVRVVRSAPSSPTNMVNLVFARVVEENQRFGWAVTSVSVGIGTSEVPSLSSCEEEAVEFWRWHAYNMSVSGARFHGRFESTIGKVLEGLRNQRG